MPELSLDILDSVFATTKGALGDIAESLERALDLKGTLSCGKPITAGRDAIINQFGGPGLLLALIVENSAACVLIADPQCRLPAWCATPDATGKSKLDTLAQEFGMLALPEQYMPSDFRAAYVGDLTASLVSGELAATDAIIPLEYKTSGGDVFSMALVWPLSKPVAALETVAAPPPQSRQESAPPPAAPRRPKVPEPAAIPRRAPASPATMGDLPQYSRSLLKIRVPVAVTLAEKRQALKRIVELGPGAIIQFEKSCEEPLHLDVGGYTVALGEAVKVGDKFGIRITSMVMPGERFEKVASPSAPHQRATA